MKQLLIASIIACGLGFALVCASLGSPSWMNLGPLTVGFFRGCMTYDNTVTCVNQLPKGLDVITPVFLFIALPALVTAIFFLARDIKDNSGTHANYAAISLAVSAMFIMIAMSVITGRMKASLPTFNHWGWGFVLGWLSFIICAIAAILAALDYLGLKKDSSDENQLI